MKQLIKFTVAFAVALLLSSTAAFAQDDTLSGKYEGTAKVAGGAESAITLDLKKDAGKISGLLMNGGTNIEVTDATFANGKLSLKLGPAGKDGELALKVDGEKLTGDWLAGTQKKSVELKKVAGSATAAVATAPAAGGSINLSGEWDAVADAQGQPFPFLLTLKVEGEKVTGSSSSQLGEATISTGAWKDGKLSFQLEGANGVIAMTGIVIEGKLSGEFDYAGQLQGKWVAVRKN